MRQRGWAPYRTALVLCLAASTITALPEPLTGVRAAGSSNWYWQNPLPNGGAGINAIACPSVTACVGVGPGGKIATTEDGGQHWMNRPSGTDADLIYLACPDSRTCYVLGTVFSAPGSSPTPAPPKQLLLRSVDGGKTWLQPVRHLPSGSGQYLSALACPTVTTCLAVGNPSLRTADGGRTWQAIRVAGLRQFGAFTCATRTTCYGIGIPATNSPPGGPIPGLIWSVDSGKTWRPRASFPRNIFPSYIACPQENTCIVSVSICHCDALRILSRPAQEADMEGDIFLTRDGGRRWKHVAHVTNSGVGDPICPRLAVCYALGAQSIIRTTDGAKSWVVRQLPGAGHSGIGSPNVACPSSMICYVAAGFAVLKTKDGFDQTTETLGHSAIHTAMNEISCPSTVTCFAVGGGAAATVNGGATWTERPRPPQPLARLNCPALTVCYALTTLSSGQPALYRSGDSARTWQKISPPVLLNDVRDISCASPESCAVTASVPGANRSQLVVIVTHDSGTTWSVQTGIDAVARAGVQNPYSPAALDRVSCPSVSTCFTVAEFIRIGVSPGDPPTRSIALLTTTDGGNTWTRHIIVPDGIAAISDLPMGLPLSCPTVNTCYLGLNDVNSSGKPLPGAVLATHDAGASWHRAMVSAGGVFNEIACPDAQVCRVTGSGEVFGTIDGGITWNSQRMVDGTQLPYLSGIACPSVDTCYAVSGVSIVAMHSPSTFSALDGTVSSRGLRRAPKCSCVSGHQQMLRGGICRTHRDRFAVITAASSHLRIQFAGSCNTWGRRLTTDRCSALTRSNISTVNSGRLCFPVLCR